MSNYPRPFSARLGLFSGLASLRNTHSKDTPGIRHSYNLAYDSEECGPLKPGAAMILCT